MSRCLEAWWLEIAPAEQRRLSGDWALTEVLLRGVPLVALRNFKSVPQMEAESFVLLSVENREILGVEPSHSNPEAAIVTVQNQGVYIYDVRLRAWFFLNILDIW